MKTQLWSSLLAILILCSCTVKHHRESNVGDKVPGEVSLASDTASIQELRKVIPEQKRLENDELKELLALMGEVKERPDRVRTKFDRILRKRRKVHKKNMKKTRDNYKKAEKKQKEDFKKRQEAAKKEFKKRKTTREQNREFYTEQDKARREFYNDIRSKRSDFDSEMRTISRDYESEIRERRREFNEELRSYRKRYNEHKRMKKGLQQQSRMGGYQRSNISSPTQVPLSKEDLNDLKVFQNMHQIPHDKLSTEDK